MAFGFDPTINRFSGVRGGQADRLRNRDSRTIFNERTRTKLQDDVAHTRFNEVRANHFGYDGISRPNRYEVTLFPPTGARGSGGIAKTPNLFTATMGERMADGTVRSAGHRCESIAMPGRNMDTTEDTNIYGPVRKIVTGYSFADVSATFQCDSNMKEKIYFETWQRLTFNTQTFAIGYYHDYVGFVDIHTLDEQDNRRYGVRLIEAYPVSINEQALSYSTNNAYQTLTVNFAYRYWQNLTDEGDLPKPLGDRIGSNGTVVRRTSGKTNAVKRKLL